ncbi:hypothetical protein BCR42DRAFT_446000 [Absidia repens]|uniref:LYR motif-containing protein Cup1-like N-terminal domain-containing protein n=1 Tax=Absidia repens TaxID=90262 RepID=A0A1X2IXH7_9FUNG|nr:hypothetical protein BCR42DRAFT_446000 [Absidia repens]
MFIPTPQHSSYIKALYKRILSEAGHFFDDRSRTFVVNRARKLFKEYKTCQDEARIKNKLLEARKRLHRLERANQGDQKSALKVLEAAYGRSGKTRHKLMHCYIHENFPADMKFPLPLIPHIPHTAPPPPLCYPLQTIVTKQLKKRLDPELPVPLYKPLHRGRQANLLWRWRSMLIQRLEVPLPFEIVCELELKAGATPDHPCFSGVLLQGGPRWNDMYLHYEKDPDLAHLCPTATATPLVPLSHLHRRLPLPRSPFSAPASVYATSTLLEMSPATAAAARQSATKDDNESTSQETYHQYRPRQVRRLYANLLKTVPLISPIPQSISLHDPKLKYSFSRSQWTAGSVTKILDLKSLPPL